MAANIKEIDHEALDGLIERLEQAKDFQLTLEAADIELLIMALQTLSTLQNQLSDKDITLFKLRKLLGMVASSEKFKRLVGKGLASHDAASEQPVEPTQAETEAQQSQQHRLVRQKQRQIGPSVTPVQINHNLEDLKKGDPCPECQRGTLSKYSPAQLLRIRGQHPYQAENHILQRLRCNACGIYVTAKLPEDVLQDGDAHQKYGYSARALMAINKYYMGQPFYRQESLSQIMGMNITASTQFDQCELVANAVYPIFKHLIRLGADAKLITIDDTRHQILEETSCEKPDRKTGKMKTRTGVYASGLMASLEDGRRIVLIQTNIGHAGEWADEVLSSRTSALDPPIVMSDALSSNHVTVTPVIASLCNAHSRRQFADLIESFPDSAVPILQQYSEIWEHDNVCTTEQMSPAKRLAYHAQRSLPIMEGFKRTFEVQLRDELVEENSGLGNAMRYFLNHYEGLIQFCRVAGAPLDNNRLETELKVLIRNRKNAYFYKTSTGAMVSDVLTSVISTCIHASVSPFDYLVWAQQNQKLVQENIHICLPWTYKT